MSRVIEAKAIISASDQTGNVFDRIAQKIKGVEKAAKSFGNLPPFFAKQLGTGSAFGFDKEIQRLASSAKEFEAIRRSIEKSFASFGNALWKNGPVSAAKALGGIKMWEQGTLNSLRRMQSGYDGMERVHQRFFRSAGRFALIAGGVGSGAYAANRVARAGIAASATSARESARDYLAGMSKEDSDRIAREAQRASGRYPSVDASTMHERLRDTAMSIRSTDKAIELSETIAQGTTVLQSLKGKDKAVEEGRKFFQALDVMGKNIDPKEVKELFHGYIKALGVEGADMDLGGVLQMARQSRAAGGILSNRFLMTTAPGLGRDLGDSQLGTSLASALSQNIGGRATKTSKTVQQEFGLRDKQGNFLDSRMAMENPDFYAWQKIMPAMQKKGIDIDDNVKVTEALAKLFSNRTVQDVFSKLITQRQQYQAKAGQYEKAPGLEGAKALGAKDPFVAYEGVLAQLRNLATQAPLMDTAAAGLLKLSGAIASLNSMFSEGSRADKIGAGLGVASVGAVAGVGGYGAFKLGSAIYQSFTGAAALTGSAAALDASAAALTAAAARLAGGATLAEVAKGGGGAAAAAGAAGGGLGAKLWGGVSAGAWAIAPAAIAAGALGGAAWLTGGDEGRGTWWAPSNPETAKRRKAHADFIRNARRSAWGYDSAGPEITDTMLHGTGVGGDKGLSVAVSGDVTGEATITIKVEAGSTLLQAVEHARTALKLAGQVNSNGPGSTGKSYPDAAAPVRPTGFNGVP
jgi:hypothetical protein